MRLYDKLIAESLALLSGRPGRLLEPPGPGQAWPEAGDRGLILRSESAYELGGGSLAAASAFGLSSSEALVGGDEVWLYGPDLPEIRGDAPYARLAFVRVAEGGLGEGEAAYAAIRGMEHARYRASPRGYMARISAASEREPVRVGKAALREGLDFAKVGGHYLAAYRARPEVLAAKLVFVTLPGFPYGELARLAAKAEAVTESLDHVLKDLVMDCASCNLKPVCDEVEGMRELHFSRGKRP